MKVSTTVFSCEDITLIKIEEVNDFVPEDYLQQFLKDNPSVVHVTTIMQKDNHMRVLLRMNDSRPTVYNTRSLLLTWCE